MPRVPILLLVLSAIPPGSLARAESPRKTLGHLETPLTELLIPAKHQDRAELSRVAARIGVARLGLALGHENQEIRQAALQALPYFPQALLLMQYLPPLVLAGPAAQREYAVQALATLLPGTDAERLSEWEIPRETTQATCKALAKAAADPTLATPSRVLALTTLGTSHATCGDGGIRPFLSDPNPTLRRAAILAAPLRDAAGKAALLAAARATQPEVAAAAGARLCRERQPLPDPKDLWRRMALDKHTAVEDLVEIIPCLAAGSTEDQTALAGLRSHQGSAVREAARATVKSGSKQ